MMIVGSSMTKQKLKCNKEAAFVGAMIFALIEAFLDEQEKSRGTTIRLKQSLLKQLRKCPITMARMADMAFQRVLTELEGKGYTMYASTVIETIFFNCEAQMKMMYGDEISSIVSNFTLKVETFGDDEETIKRSYVVADMLSKEFQKEAQ